MSLLLWKSEQFSKKYLHFDEQVSIEKIWDLIKKREYVASRAFLPFIHYQQRFIKYSAKKQKKIKERDIYYCSHFDRHIYALYSYKLNQLYNRRAKFLGIDDCSIAYRTNKHLNTIDFARRVFANILFCKNNCLIFVGDFTNFFDHLEHRYLKRQLLTFTSKEKLPPDYYAVFKSITKFSFVEQDDITSKLAIASRKNRGLYDPKKRKLFKSAQEFRLFKKNTLVKKNSLSCGIPQGSPVSAVLSNIYMMDFDHNMNQFAQAHNGWYFRYSDDFIVILPSTNCGEKKNILRSKIPEYVGQIPLLKLQPEKCKTFFYDVRSNSLSEFDDRSNELIPSRMSYLGFSFDGKKIRIRDRTIGKYYYRAYAKASVLRKQLKNGAHRGRGRLYYLYTLKGDKRSNQTGEHVGNFLTYIRRANKCFRDLPFEEKITSRHYGKIKKRLNKN